MIRISNIHYPITLDETNLPEYVSKKYKLKNIKAFEIVKQSVDARKKNDIHYVYSVDVASDNEDKLIRSYKNITPLVKKPYTPPIADGHGKKAVVVGFGPAGMMCSHLLAQSGFKVVIIERGECVDDRLKTVNLMKEKGILNPDSNIQFGEGGAGTFSDGKLTTGVNDERTGYVLQKFVENGAPAEILYRAKPHVGTDNLVNMVKSFRKNIIHMGGDIRFGHKLTGINIDNNCLKSINVTCPHGEYIEDTDILVLATGHSARDVFSMLKDCGAKMERKVFSVGARIEHKQDMINTAQYGDLKDLLPVADYKLSYKTKSGRGVYTFCMCPGGEVVASASEEGGIVTNGMSYFKRDGENANSALLVNVTPQDLQGDDVLEGCRFQRDIEKKAYNLCGGYIAPYQTVGDFLHDNDAQPTVNPTYKPGVKKCKLTDIFPRFVTDAMKEAIPELDKKLKGFADEGAILTAPETRSSSPVRIIRSDDTLMSNIFGIYPTGEGAGYAGGIMTAAVDGMRVAEKIIEIYGEK